MRLLPIPGTNVSESSVPRSLPRKTPRKHEARKSSPSGLLIIRFPQIKSPWKKRKDHRQDLTIWILGKILYLKYLCDLEQVT